MTKLLSMLLALCMLAMAMPALAQTGDDADTWAASQAELLAPEQRTLNIFTWTYYIPDEVVERFSAATGIQVNYSETLGNEDMLAKLSTGSELYDIVLCSDYIISDMIGEGLLTELDPDRIPNYKNINPAYQAQFYDPDNQYTIPYANTVPLIVYNPDMVDFEITGYADLWDESLSGRLACVAERRVIIGMAQKKLGLSYNETDPGKMAQAEAELLKLKPNILLLNDDTPHNALISLDAAAGFMFGSQVVEAKGLLPQLKVVYPKEGLGFGIDNLVVPKGAPHMDAAYIFLNYLLYGEISANASELINYGSCNLAAQDYLSQRYLGDATVNVPQELIDGAEMIMPLDDEALALYNDIWVNFRQ